MDWEHMSDADLKAAEAEARRRSEAAHQEYMRRTHYEPRAKAEAELITRLQEQYGVDEDAQGDIYIAWCDFYDNWG